MPSARSSSPPDLMALLCLMGGAVRSAGEFQLMMQLLTIAALVPPIGTVLETWIAAEERAGRDAAESGAWFDDAEGETDQIGLVLTRQNGRMLLWRHVTRFGTVLPVLLDCPWLRRCEPLASPRASWSVALRLSPLFRRCVFEPVLPLTKMHALFVTISL